MRIAAFLFALSLFTGSFLLRTSAQHPPSSSDKFNVGHENVGHKNVSQVRSDGVRMISQAEILVLPADVVASNRAELASLRDRVAQAEVNLARLEVSDPAVREQLSRQLQLTKALLDFSNRQYSDAGKSRAAIQVEHHLNEIEGRVMCEACHSSPAKAGLIGQ